MPVVVKGVLRGDDARRCVDCGVKGIMVSNHGGRHLDTTVTTAEVIAEIADAVGQQRRGLCRRRHPARHRHRQGAGARRARRAGRAAAAVGPRRQRRGRRADGAGASARRDGAGDAALRRGEPCGADAGFGEAMKELIPTGKLRVGVAFAPSPSPLFVVKDTDGTPRGVTVDLAERAGAAARRRRSSSWSRPTPASWSMRWKQAASICRSCRSTKSARSASTSARSISWSRAPTW